MAVTALSGRCGDYNSTDEYWKNEEKIPLAVVMACIFFVAFTSNLLLMCVILRNPKLRTVPNKLVFNLSLCGLFTVIFNGPFVVSTLLKGTWIYSCLMCALNGFTTTVYGFSAITTLAIISVNRYQLVKMPNERQKIWITPDRLPYVISSIWIFSCLLAMPPLSGWSNYDYIPARAICTLKWSTDLYYTSFIIILGVALPFIVILVSYFKIFLTVRNSFRNLKSHQRQRDSIRQENICPETTAHGLKSDLTQPMTTRLSDENYVSSMTRKIWLKRKNRVRPNDQSLSLDQKKQGIELCALHENNVKCVTNGEYEKDHVDAKVIDRKTFSKGNRDNLTDNFIKENNKLLLIQLERSMGLRKKQLKPIKVNDTSKDEREHSTKRMEIVNTKSKSRKSRENKKKKIQDGKLPVKTLRSNATIPREQMGNNEKLRQSDTKLYGIPADTASNKLCAKEYQVCNVEKLPVATKSTMTGNSGKEYSSKDKVDSSLQSSMKSSENSDSKLLSLHPKHQNLNSGARAFTGEMFISNLPSFAPKKLFSHSVKKSGQRTVGSTSMRDELRITAMLFVILASFLMCWAPIAIVNLIETISSEPLSQGVNEFSVFMMFFSSVVNPLIYGLLNRNFRNECSHLCRYKCKYNHSSNTNTERRTHGAKNVFTVVA